MSYKLPCFIPGGGSIFPVKINKQSWVGELKDTIKEKTPVTLGNIDAHYLTLYRVEVDEDMIVRSGPTDLNECMKLDNAEQVLSAIFGKRPPEGKKYYVFVQVPEAAPKTPPPTSVPHRPLQHTPTKPRAQGEIDEEINRFLSKCRPRMQVLAKEASNGSSLLKLWEPKYPENEDLAKHIKKLSIPVLSKEQPSLLLHGLGEEKDSNIDREPSAPLQNIFARCNTALINTSGSGKTRLLLEGLCCWWGFYFVAKPDTTGIGSNDLWMVISELDSSLDYKEAKRMTEGVQKPEVIEAGHQHMKEVAERRFAQLLLARFLLLNLLVEVAQEIEGGLRPREHRRLWVLLQAQPELFERKIHDDIFTQLTRLLRYTPTLDLKEWIGRQRETLEEKLLGDGELSIYCVLDEVQITLSSPSGHLGEFMSTNKTTKRHILREIWLLWNTVLRSSHMRLVLSGTGIELRALEDTMSSTSLKSYDCTMVHDTGFFEDDSAQAKYIRQYLPASLHGPTWVEFFTRAWAWFRGRYRYTATLITLILQGGYRSPHRTIDEYVKTYTGFRPTDGEIWADRELPLPSGFMDTRVTNLNFEKMDPAQAETLRDILYDQLLYGKYNEDAFSDPQKRIFVEYGFARVLPFETVIDEPLAILAARKWVNTSTKYRLFNYLRNNIHKHATRQNGFEAYLAFYIQAVFGGAPVLDAVFTFRSDFTRRRRADLAWQREKFELVTVVDSGDEQRVSVVTPSSGPSSNVGSSANSPREVLDWISTNRSQYAFCFPPESLGPDLLFFVRSKVSGGLLLVALQGKKYKLVDKGLLTKGVRTVTPSWFWKSKDKKYATADTAPFIDKDKDMDMDTDTDTDKVELAAETKKVLADIQHGLKGKGADYPILRVFASWPGEAKLERTLEWTASSVVDLDEHPLAALRLDTFNEVGAKLDEDWFRGNGEQEVVVPSKKRAREEQDSESSVLRKRAPKALDALCSDDSDTCSDV